MKFAYFGFDILAPCLEALLQDGHELTHLFTFFSDNQYDFNVRVVNLATSCGAPVTFAPPGPQDIERLYQQGCRMFVSCAYAYKIPPLPDDAYGFNLHPTLLPRGQGRFPLPYVLMHHRDAAGITLHKIAPQFDTGDILRQKAIPLYNEDDMETLSCRIVREAPAMVVDAVRNIESYWSTAKPQNKDDMEYWPFPPDAMRTISWDMHLDEIDRVGKAFGRAGWYAEIEGQKYMITRYSFWKEQHDLPPGTVSTVLDREAAIAAKDGFVCLKEYNAVE